MAGTGQWVHWSRTVGDPSAGSPGLAELCGCPCLGEGSLRKPPAACLTRVQLPWGCSSGTTLWRTLPGGLWEGSQSTTQFGVTLSSPFLQFSRFPPRATGRKRGGGRLESGVPGWLCLKGHEGKWRKTGREGGGRSKYLLGIKLGRKVSGLYPYPSLDFCTDPDGCTSCSAVNRLT